MRSALSGLLSTGMLTLLLSSHGSAATDDSQLPALSVCSALAHRSKYNGSIIAVRGVVVGTEEGMWLEAFPACRDKLVTGKIAWPTMISLEAPDNESPNPADHVAFTVDRTALLTLGLYVPKGFDKKADVLVKTYVGLFQTYSDLDHRAASNDYGTIRQGFGHLGGSPARLLIKSVRDVTAVKKNSKLR